MKENIVKVLLMILTFLKDSITVFSHCEHSSQLCHLSRYANAAIEWNTMGALARKYLSVLYL